MTARARKAHKIVQGLEEALDHARATNEGMPDHDGGVPSDANRLPADGEWHWVKPKVTVNEETQRRSDVVGAMKEERSLPKLPVTPVSKPLSPYTDQTIDEAKMRECMTTCAQMVVDGFIQAAKIVVRLPDALADISARADAHEWNPVGDGTPLGAWLETKVQTGPNSWEGGTNTCMCRVMSIGDKPEWIEKKGGRTTVTHSTFLAPTHWRWPLEA